MKGVCAGCGRQTFIPEPDAGMEEAYASAGGLPKPVQPLSSAEQAPAPTPPSVVDEIQSDDPEVLAAIQSAQDLMKLKSDQVILDTVNCPVPLQHGDSREALCSLSDVDFSVLLSSAFYEKCLDGRFNMVRISGVCHVCHVCFMCQV